MGNKRRIMIQLAVAAVLCLVLAISASADNLIFRDDFVCYDTLNTPYPDRNAWNDVSIDSAGRITETNITGVPTGPWSEDLFYQFNRFDKFGDQSQPVTYFLPDTISADSIWGALSMVWSHSNNSGSTFMAGHIHFTPDLKTAGFLFGPDGQQVGDPICFDCDIPYPYYVSNLNGDGAINNHGLLAVVWKTQDHISYDDSLYVRLYDPETETFSDLVSPMTLPKLIPTHNVEKYPRVGLTDDGSFAVAWICRDQILQGNRPYYAVYNADLTPRTDMLLANWGTDTTGYGRMKVNSIDLAMGSDGDFYITWGLIYRYIPSCHNGSAAFMRGFNADGTPKYDPVQLNDTDSLNLCDGFYTAPSIACNDSGYVLVVWSDNRHIPGFTPYHSTERNAFAQKVNPDGNLVGPNYQVNDTHGELHTWGEFVGCDLNNAGQTVISWRNDYYEGTTHRVEAQLTPYHDIGTYVQGDVNQDRECNILDMVTLLEWMFRGGDTLYYFWPKDIIDINGDGHMANISDVTYLVNYMFGVPVGPAPHTPYEGIRQPPPHIVADDILPAPPELDQPNGGLNDLNQCTDDRRLDDLDQRLDTESRHHINTPPRPDDLEQPAER